MIIGILILGLALRLISLNQSLWLDEAVQAITAQGSFVGIFTELQGDFHPPLYHFLMWTWVRLFGSSEVILRLPSVIFGTATVYLVYLIAKESFTSGASPRRRRFLPLVAALFLAAAPFHIYYSQEARMYAMTAFLASLSMYYFMRVMSKETRPLVIGYILPTTLLLYSDYFGFLVLLAQVIGGAVIFRKRMAGLSYCFMIPFLLWLFWLPMFRTQFQAGLQATQVLPEWGRLVSVDFLKALPLTFIKFSVGRITIFNKKLYAVVAGFLFLVYGLTIARGFFKKGKFIIHNSLFIILSWLFIPILSAWVLSLFVPNYQPFRLLLVLPAFYLLLAYGISRIPILIVRLILILAILGVNLSALSVYYFRPYFHREDWRGMVQYIESQAEESLAILPSEISNWPWRYYSSGKVKAIGISPGARQVAQGDFSYITAGQSNYETIYFVRYLVPLFDSQEKISFWLADNGFVKIREVSFNQIPLWVYQKQ